MIYYVALIRGINVGKAKRISMEDLKALVERLGYEDVRTVLNTGNVVFKGKKAAEWTIAARIQEALETRHGFTANTLVLTATDLDSIIRENPLSKVATDPAKFLVGFVMDQKVLFAARALSTENWGDENLAVTNRAAYVWSPGGVLASKALKAFDAVGKDLITTRNWTTVLKIQTATRVRD
ncbi:MAG: DUF1697 domain-containing protein [Acidimicrobiia bacterium]|nr:DUF1697 domain-containing protein [Acidimicrobiia bacterium]